MEVAPEEEEEDPRRGHQCLQLHRLHPPSTPRPPAPPVPSLLLHALHLHLLLSPSGRRSREQSSKRVVPLSIIVLIALLVFN